MKIDLEDANVTILETTVEKARDDGFAESEDFFTALDETQAIVFQGQSDVAYLVIKITK